MSKVWSALKSGLKFNCTACGKCCNNKRSNVSLNLSEIESMSEALGMDKLSFMGKYTEEKVIDGTIYTKLLHKKDLSCVLLDIDGKECTVHASRPIQCRSYPFMAEHIIGEAEWLTESRKCEGIIIDSSFPLLHPERLESVVDEEMSIDEILYDGVTADYENTYHGNLNVFYAKNLKPIVTDESKEGKSSLLNIETPVNTTVLPDTIIRQMIIHEIHSNGLGPDWNYEDSLGLLLDSEDDSIQSTSSNILDNFRNEFCASHYSKTVYEDDNKICRVSEKNNLLRVVDTTTPVSISPELLFHISNDCNTVLEDHDYKYDLEDLQKELNIRNIDSINNMKSNNNDKINNDKKSISFDDNDVIIRETVTETETETKRRFEFIHSDNLSQTEMFLLPYKTQDECQDHGLLRKCDHSRLIMPVHQILGLISEKLLMQYSKIEKEEDKKNKNNIKNNGKNILPIDSPYRWSIIGAGGFALPSYFDLIISSFRLDRNIIIDAIEPEIKVLKIAKKYFDAKYETCPANYNYNKKPKQKLANNILSHEIDGLSYLQKYFPLNKMIKVWNGSGFQMEEEKNENFNSSKIDFLILDAFEDSQNSNSNFGPEGQYNNRAPPESLLSDIDLLVRSLKPFIRQIENNVTENLSNDMSNENEKQNLEKDKSYIKSKSRIFDLMNRSNEGECSGGILAINLFGPDEWISEVFYKIKNCSNLSDPLLIKIKNQKNILLLTSRISE